MSSSNSRSNPVGVRFRPTDEELISFLRDKVLGHDVHHIAMLDDFCKYEPRDLPGLSSMVTDDQVWYFFYPPNYKYKDSKRVNRTTGSGYWKLTGKHREIKSGNGTVIGEKKTLVFYEGSIRKGNGKRTSFVMHEYELISNLPNQKKWLVLCKLKKKDDGNADAFTTDENQPSYDLPAVAGEDANANTSGVSGNVDELYELCHNLPPEWPQLHGEQPPVHSSWTSTWFSGSSTNTTQNHDYSSGTNEEDNESWRSYLL